MGSTTKDGFHNCKKGSATQKRFGTTDVNYHSVVEVIVIFARMIFSEEMVWMFSPIGQLRGKRRNSAKLN